MMSSAVVDVVVGLLSATGALLVLASAVAMLRERDAFCRITCLSPATGLGLPLIVIAAFVHKTAYAGFTDDLFVKTLLTVASLLIVSSVASNVLARAAYLSGAPVDASTEPQDLARDPDVP